MLDQPSANLYLLLAGGRRSLRRRSADERCLRRKTSASGKTWCAAGGRHGLVEPDRGSAIRSKAHGAFRPRRRARRRWTASTGKIVRQEFWSGASGGQGGVARARALVIGEPSKLAALVARPRLRPRPGPEQFVRLLIRVLAGPEPAEARRHDGAGAAGRLGAAARRIRRAQAKAARCSGRRGRHRGGAHAARAATARPRSPRPLAHDP